MAWMETLFRTLATRLVQMASDLLLSIIHGDFSLSRISERS